jgi:hypothetical protein
MKGSGALLLLHAAVLLLSSVSVDAGSHVYFGMYDAEVNPGGGWQLMGASDFEDYRLKFISSYNGNGGIDLIKPFKTQRACGAWPVALGPAPEGIRCDVHRMPVLSLCVCVWGGGAAGSAQHSPSPSPGRRGAARRRF